MGRTSIKNKLILSFLGLLFIFVVVVGVVNELAIDYFLGQAISTALALAAGITFGNIFSRSLTKRLSRLSNIAREISRGDLSKEIPCISRDEVRDLEEIFAVMVNDLRAMISDIKNASLQIQETNVNLTKLASKVLSNSREIDQSAMAIAKSSEEQTVIVKMTSITLEKSSEKMDEMVKQSANTVSKINEARLKTELGETKAHETLKHLQEVLKQTDEYTAPIYRLAGKVEKIKIVMNVMEELAQKTDLLSLNASIEATRAGELGKGFALVANEIRNMAENSKQSSLEIAKLVEDIFEDNKAAIEALGKSQIGINKGREIIRVIVATFGEMLSGVKDISREVGEMQEVTSKQTGQIRGLLKRFQELSRLAGENFISTQKTTVGTKKQEEDVKEIVSAIESLNALSQKMIKTQQHLILHES